MRGAQDHSDHSLGAGDAMNPNHLEDGGEISPFPSSAKPAGGRDRCPLQVAGTEPWTKMGSFTT